MAPAGTRDRVQQRDAAWARARIRYSVLLNQRPNYASTSRHNSNNKRAASHCHHTGVQVCGVYGPGMVGIASSRLYNVGGRYMVWRRGRRALCGATEEGAKEQRAEGKEQR